VVFESYLRAIVSISALDKNTVQVVALENTCRHREYCCAAARTEMEKALFFIIFKTSEKKSVIELKIDGSSYDIMTISSKENAKSRKTEDLS